MNRRFSRFFTASIPPTVGVGGLLIALAGACGGAAATDVTTPPATDTDGGSSGSSGSMASGGTSGTSGSSGDAAATGDAAASNPFTSAPAFTPTTGRNTLQPGDHPGTGNPSKLACLDCHGPGGNAPRFFAAGSVFKDVAGTMPAAQVEVRLLADNGKAISTHSDTLGNFVVTANAATAAGVAFPIHVGARDGTTTQVMTAVPANGDCNNASCHGGSQGWIHVP